ncbi:hypothetical protein [Dysgonomonas sp. 511]|uniref:hypothetical protein n=1 Tax=Dysgonomonas sp. 511 TaxID=2302930 RepID=UPI0013D08C36|nr:hypothetical protein [Dysgonomonas sp. 511]NDV79087.1 hypothetical protein [Dysgonomonas sp. 511]
MTLRYTKKPLRNTEGEKISSELNSPTPMRGVRQSHAKRKKKVTRKKGEWVLLVLLFRKTQDTSRRVNELVSIKI